MTIVDNSVSSINAVLIQLQNEIDSLKSNNSTESKTTDQKVSYVSSQTNGNETAIEDLKASIKSLVSNLNNEIGTLKTEISEISSVEVQVVDKLPPFGDKNTIYVVNGDSCYYCDGDKFIALVNEETKDINLDYVKNYNVE